MKAMRPVALGTVLVCVIVLAACDATTPTVAPSPTANPSTLAARPAIRIDPSWKASNGRWTFTGTVDPQGDPTDVILEIGPGPSTLRHFDQQVSVANGLTDPGPLTISTTNIPDIPEICVRFSATNGAGTSSTSPLCFPHDVSSTIADNDPPVTLFSAPATGSTVVVHAAAYTVAWTESDVGTGVSTRSLQRRVALYTGGACGAFGDDGPAGTAQSPVTVTGLLGGRCYQWIQSLSDHAGMTTQRTSGTVRVDLGT
jgi:hypothetical protein